MSSELSAILRSALVDSSASGLCAAFSGGPDSTALLHALAQLPQARERGLRALHIDHGLHADSNAWAKRCTDFCESLGVPLTTIRVQVDDTHGEGIEAAARRARYTAFATHLREGEWLALAHHRDDQIETVMLKLLRGAGPEGLGGMRALRPFVHGMLWRPLLETPRAALQTYATEHALASIDDPANADPRFARSMLRTDVLPRVAAHWPHAGASILHTSRLCRVVTDYLDAAARTALADLRRADDTLDAADWLALPEALRAPVLDAWLHAHGLPAPPDASRAELERQTARAAGDRVPLVAWADAQVHVWDTRLYATPLLEPAPVDWQAAWEGAPLELPQDCGGLRLESAHATRTHWPPIDPPLAVRFRRGGERIKPDGDAHTRELRDLFQRARMPPWLRSRCPLIYADDELIAVADLWASARGRALFAQSGAVLHWLRPAWATTARSAG